MLPVSIFAIPVMPGSVDKGQSLAGMKCVMMKQAPLMARSQKRDPQREGVTAQLRYEQIANMHTPRMGHQVFPSGNGIVVAGGHTTGFQLTPTAEFYQDGTWTSLSIDNAHDGAFSVQLPDGRFMVGGGFSAAGGVGQSKTVDIYNPNTRTFTAGPQMTVARAQCQAICEGSRVYVSGNWYADDKVMDCYDGSSFTAVGDMDGRSVPYLFADRSGNIYSMSPSNVKGQSFGFYTYDDGSVGLLADKFLPATGNTQYFGLPFSPQLYPMALSGDTRPSDYHVVYGGNNCYIVLARTSDGYMLLLLDFDDAKFYAFNTFNIPTADASGAAITWRGGVLVNSAKQETYLIGTSGTNTNQTLHVISLNYVSSEWTIASASGFTHNLLSASWTILADGRIACTGGSINDNTDALSKAYLITPPVAGQADSSPDEPQGENTLVVLTKDGVQTTYLLSEKPEVRFIGRDLRVVSTKADVTYKISDILRFTYIKRNASGIDNVIDDPAEVEWQDGTLVISKLKANATVVIYSPDGKMVRRLQARHTGTYRLSLSELPKGVYIVKADNVSYKIMKR